MWLCSRRCVHTRVFRTFFSAYAMEIDLFMCIIPLSVCAHTERYLIFVIVINICTVYSLERDWGMHRLLGCLQSWHQYLYTHKGSEMFWMHVGNTDMQQPGCCSLGCFPNILIVCFHGGNIHCKLLIAFPWKQRWLDREDMSACPEEHSSLIKLSEMLKRKVGWIFCQDRYVEEERKCWLVTAARGGWGKGSGVADGVL